jgi:hypothetical protein
LAGRSIITKSAAEYGGAAEAIQVGAEIGVVTAAAAHLARPPILTSGPFDAAGAQAVRHFAVLKTPEKPLTEAYCGVRTAGKISHGDTESTEIGSN